MKKISRLNISDRMKLKLINKGIQESRRNHIKRLIIEDPDSYLLFRESQIKYLDRFKKKNPGYIENWRKKNPKKYEKYNKNEYRKRKQAEK